MKELKIVAKIRKCVYEELNNTEKKLVDAAKNAANIAYAPYSGFQVGAAVLLEDDIIVAGNNQENIAYPSGICAERVAMFSSNANYPHSAPLALAIAAYYKGKLTENFIAPCGACRQVLLEAENRYGKPIQLLLCGSKEICIVDSVGDLLPLAFSYQHTISAYE
jgi:cytidine deaminase